MLVPRLARLIPTRVETQRMLPFWPIAMVPGSGQYRIPCGADPTGMVCVTRPVATSTTVAVLS